MIRSTGQARRRWQHLGALVALVALTAACGARLSDEQMTAARSTGGAVQSTGSAATGEVAGTTDTTVAPTTGEPVAAGATPTGEAAPAAPAEGAASAAPAAAPGGGGGGGGGGECRPRGSGEGFSESQITIGNVSTVSGPVPGLGRTAQAGVKAFVAYINSKGGICGRKVVLEATDDRLDTGTNRSEHQRMAGSVLAFVGGWSVVDDGGASILQGTNIPDIGLALNDQRITLPNNFSPNPIDPTAQGNGNAPKFAWFKANRGASKVAIVYPAQASARKRALAYRADVEQAGLQMVAEIEVAITQTDYTGVATQIKNAGADVVVTALEVGGMAKLAQAMKQQNYTPKVAMYGAQAYSQTFLKQAGAAAEGTLIATGVGIVEDAGSVPAMAEFRQWYTRVNPGADIDFFALLSWAAGAMFAEAALEAGPTPTRDAVLERLRTKTDFTAGGILAPKTNPAGKKPSPCFVVIGVEGGAWKRVHPAQGYQC